MLIYAPYLPQLVREGFPTLTSQDVGFKVRVEGAAVPRGFNPAERVDLEPKLAQMFTESEGAALLVAHNGSLALEHYGLGVGAETKFNSFSIAKSLVGALVFKALVEGKIASLDQTLGELLPEASGLSKMTLRQILTMRSGVHFDARTSSFGTPGSAKDSDTFPNPFGPLARLHFQGADAILGGLTMDEEPPDTFNYQNVNTALLGRVLERAYDRPLEDLLSEKIWAPAGAQTAAWRKPSESRSVSAYCCIYATARDWLRIGMFWPPMARPISHFFRSICGVISSASMCPSNSGSTTTTAIIPCRTFSTGRARTCRGSSPTSWARTDRSSTSCRTKIWSCTAPVNATSSSIPRSMEPGTASPTSNGSTSGHKLKTECHVQYFRYPRQRLREISPKRNMS